MTITELFTAIGSCGTLLGVVILLFVLKRDHDWRRRKYAIDIVRDWNEKVLRHVREIEKEIPHLFDADIHTLAPAELTKQKAIEVYNATAKGSTINPMVRHHMSELLNYMEFVAMAYTNSVADSNVVEECLVQSLVRVPKTLKNYIELVQERRGYQPWQSYLNVVSKWSAKDVSMRSPTG
jgi:hypothetical protein